MQRSPLLDRVTQSDATDHPPAGNSGEPVDASATIDHRRLYRLPWSLPDNAIAWLEPTKKCNLACLGCYRENDPRGHKTLDEVRHDLDVFERFRTVDGVSIAGGDPLVHPQIVEIVRMVAQDGLKPIVNTNGLALSEELLGELKGAGVAGFTFHIDSKQGRPRWKHADEIELCELRQRYAEMVAAVGGIGCSFNATVYEDTLRQVPDIVRVGAAQHRDRQHDRVHRLPRGHGRQRLRPLRARRAGRLLRGALRHHRPDSARAPVDRHRGRDPQALPDFAPAAYLNGTERPDTFKWLLTGRLGAKGKIYGYVGPRSMELAQTFHHLRTGRYLAYSSPRALSHGRAMLALSALDPRLRTIARRWLAAGARRPSRLLERLHFQSVMIIQPADIYADGRQNMCDGCPDMTVWNDRLVWSCRLEEPERFGDFVQMVPKSS